MKKQLMIAALFSLVGAAAIPAAANPQASLVAADRGAPAHIRAEATNLGKTIASKRNWPQRKVRASSDGVWVPVSPTDPVDYRRWVDALPDVVGDRVPGGVEVLPGSPGRPVADLERIKVAVRTELLPYAQRARVGLGLVADPVDGVVRIEHAPSSDAEFNAALAKVRADHAGQIKVVSTTISTKVLSSAAATPGMAPTATTPSRLVTKGGYRISLWDNKSLTISTCTLGVNVTKAGAKYFITAAHCIVGNNFDRAAQRSAYLDVSTSTRKYLGYLSGSMMLPRPSGAGSDMALIRYSNYNSINPLSAAYAYNPGDPVSTVQLVGATTPKQMAWSCGLGATTKVRRCGYVKDACATAYLPSGHSLACALAVGFATQQGDSGSPLWVSAGSASKALAAGILSGGSSTTSYFSRLVPALKAWGATVP